MSKQTLGFYRETKGLATVHIGSTVESLMSVFSSKANNKAIRIRSEINTEVEVQAIPGEIRQLIGNLLSNSIDAVPAGGEIRIRVAAGRYGGDAGVRVTVCDNGPGIPEDVRAHIFEPFFTTKTDVGTGLGLWVCKSIVQKHHGSIRLRSSTSPGGSGTVFSVFLPSQAKPVTVDAFRKAV
jgi:signal transduction histidine kinase